MLCGIFKGFANESIFGIDVAHAQSTYHETQQIRAYDIESLIGDIGGYMGLFLGYTILHLPNFFHVVMGLVQKIVLKIKRDTIYNKTQIIPVKGTMRTN